MCWSTCIVQTQLVKKLNAGLFIVIFIFWYCPLSSPVLVWHVTSDPVLQRWPSQPRLFQPEGSMSVLSLYTSPSLPNISFGLSTASSTISVSTANLRCFISGWVHCGQSGSGVGGSLLRHWLTRGRWWFYLFQANIVLRCLMSNLLLSVVITSFVTLKKGRVCLSATGDNASWCIIF